MERILMGLMEEQRIRIRYERIMRQYERDLEFGALYKQVYELTKRVYALEHPSRGRCNCKVTGVDMEMFLHPDTERIKAIKGKGVPKEE
jgi:hypothetical protein